VKREPKNISASVQARLLQRSRDLNVEHQLTLARFGGERLLYRLSKSEFADRFILKGAAMLLVWMGDAIRPTKDIDLLGFGDTSAEGSSASSLPCAKSTPPTTTRCARSSLDLARDDPELVEGSGHSPWRWLAMS
jgi:hypothetical protein